MRSDWKDFLNTQGARIEGGRLLDFGDTHAERTAMLNGTVITDLSRFGVLACSGGDAAIFLHSQLTNDIKGLPTDSSVYAAYCSAKGRMLANFLVWRRAGKADQSLPERFELLMPDELLSSIKVRLNIFLMRAKAKIDDVTDSHVHIGIAGPRAAVILQESQFVVPDEPHKVTQSDGHVLIRLEQNRFILSIDPEKAPAAWKSLTQLCTPVGSACWEWLDIRAGIPWLGHATQGQFIPQMANLELIGGVSFKKGCYPGQEIVARTQYLGQVKRRMVRARIETDLAPEAGDALFGIHADSESNGMVVNAQAGPDGGYDVLAVVQTSSLESGIRLHGPQGPTLTIFPLPYAV